MSKQHYEKSQVTLEMRTWKFKGPFAEERARQLFMLITAGEKGVVDDGDHSYSPVLGGYGFSRMDNLEYDDEGYPTYTIDVVAFSDVVWSTLCKE